MTIIAIAIMFGGFVSFVAAIFAIDWLCNRKIKRAEIEYLGAGAETDRRKTIISYDKHTTII